MKVSPQLKIGVSMIANATNLISSFQAMATVNEWLVCYVGDRFVAHAPKFDPAVDVWRVPVLYLYPQGGSLGVVGTVIVDALPGELCAPLPTSEIKRQALQLYQARYGSPDSFQ